MLNKDIDMKCVSAVVCAAPWVEGVLYADGTLSTCCRNKTILGNWKKDGLANAYNSPLFQEFRIKFADGEIPDVSCRDCINNGANRTIESELVVAYSCILNEITPTLKENVNELHVFFSVLKHHENSDFVKENISKCKKTIEDWLEEYHDIKRHLLKLIKIIEIAESYYERKTVVSAVVPFRQVALKTKCNARCIHCPFLYTGAVINGMDMPRENFNEAFSSSQDMVGFFMHGSEFLYYDNWKNVADILKENMVPLGFSTNGILLTPANTRYLIDNKLANVVSISLDGATKETVESIRRNVKYDELLQNIEYLIEYVVKKKYPLALSFSFVLMKRNYNEYPEMIKIISEIKERVCKTYGENMLSPLNFYCQTLEPPVTKENNAFLAKEHISLVKKDELISMFNKCLELKKMYDITIGVWYTSTLEDFINAGYPIPPMPEYSANLKTQSPVTEGVSEKAELPYLQKNI